MHARVGTLLSSVLLARDRAELLLVLVALLLVVGACERLIGSRRTALAWAATAVVGGVVGTALQAAGLLAHGLWATPPATAAVLHPETPVLGVLLTASAFSGPLWCRRIRLIGLAALLVLLLYSGQPEDLDHLAGASAGLLLGIVLTRTRARPSFPRSSHHEARSLLAALIAVAAVGPMVALAQRTGYGILRPLGRLIRDPAAFGEGRERCVAAAHAVCGRPGPAHVGGPGTVLLEVLPLLVLLVAAAAVQRGRRFGAWLAAGTAVVLALLAALYYGVLPALDGGRRGSGVTIQSALAVLVPLGVAVVALLWRRHCGVLPTRRALVAGAASVGIAVTAAAALYVGGGLLVRAQFAPRPGVLDLLAALPEHFVPIGFLRFHRVDFVPTGPVASVLDDWVGAGAWSVLLIAAIGVAASARRTSTVREQVRLRTLLRTGARGSIAWMATWRGNRTWFSADGRHAIAFREGSGVALTVGEPVGEAEGAVAAALAFAVHCDDLGLVPAFYAVRPQFAAALTSAGATWSTVEVGEDAVIDPRGFTMRGRHWQDVRSSVHRAERAGVRAVWTTWTDLPAEHRAQIEAISEQWIGTRVFPELGFTLGGIAELADREVRMLLAIGGDDRVQAVTSWLPTWRDGEVVGLTLDLMRRPADSMSGVMEFLIAEAIALAQRHGMHFVSLSVLPLGGAEDGDDDRLQRLLAGTAKRLEPAYGFRSLAAFKEKFLPEHRPQLLVYPDAVALPAVALAIARAYLPSASLPEIGRAVTALRGDDVARGRVRLRGGRRRRVVP